MGEREQRLNIRLSETERQMLNELAESQAQTISDFLRFVIRQKHAEKFSDKQPKKKR